MTSIYDAINKRADAIKARKQAEHQSLVRKTYSGDEKITSQYSDDDYHSQVDDPQSLGILNTQDSLRTRTTERAALLSAGGVIEVEPNAPLLDRPNKYTNLKRCAHPNHTGDRWVNRSQFSADKHHSDGLHAYCKKCRAEQRRFAYVPKWRRGV